VTNTAFLEPNTICGLKNNFNIIYLLSIYIKMGVQKFVGMWRANGNPNPCTDLDEILHAHPHLSKEGFGRGLTPASYPLEPVGPKTLKAEGHIFKMLSRLQINQGSDGYLS